MSDEEYVSVLSGLSSAEGISLDDETDYTKSFWHGNGEFEPTIFFPRSDDKMSSSEIDAEYHFCADKPYRHMTHDTDHFELIPTVDKPWSEHDLMEMFKNNLKLYFYLDEVTGNIKHLFWENSAGKFPSKDIEGVVGEKIEIDLSGKIIIEEIDIRRMEEADED